MKIKNVNWEKIKRIGGVALCSLVLGTVMIGSILIHDKLINKEQKYPMLKQIETADEEKLTKLVIDNVTYLAPNGYELEIINNHVYAVKRYYIVFKPGEIELDNGETILDVRSDDVVLDGLAYREVVDLIEPDTNKIEEYEEETSYKM